MPPELRTEVRTGQLLETITGCRLCRSPELEPVWSFGTTPLANAYLAPEELGNPELTAPLEVVRCPTCELLQLRHTVSPEALFRNYLYVSSTSPVFVAHFDAYARHLAARFSLNETSLVVDVGSNDGALLKPLKQRGVRVLGVEPAARIADMANAAGVETIDAFFTPDLASRIRTDRGPAAVIAANNVFAHIADLHAVVEGVRRLLADDGVSVFEVQYLGDLLEKNLFDIVYHEHLCYYHLTPLVSFLAEQDMEVFDVQRVPVHGGSLRVFVQRAGGPHQRQPRVEALLAEERTRHLGSKQPYAAFAARIAENKRRLMALLSTLRADQKRIVGYGAPAKATTFLYAFGIGPETLEYIVDDDRVFKQGRHMPGLHIPIAPPERLLTDRPEYCLILAWNFAEPIIQKQAHFTAQGGRFIVPVPEPRIV